MHLRMLRIMMCFEIKWVSSDSTVMKNHTKSFLVISLEYPRLYTWELGGWTSWVLWEYAYNFSVKPFALSKTYIFIYFWVRYSLAHAGLEPYPEFEFLSLSSKYWVYRHTPAHLTEENILKNFCLYLLPKLRHLEKCTITRAAIIPNSIPLKTSS